jgi:hypothetical protein
MGLFQNNQRERAKRLRCSPKAAGSPADEMHMILNNYAVLDGFLSLLRLVLGLLTVWLGVALWQQQQITPFGEQRQALEDRCHLVFVMATVLVGLSIASWPVFYLLLQSYVPEWPGIMCIYGVTRIGAGSVGISRFLPPLVRGLEIVKPTLVFAGGSWFTFYLINRRTRTAPLLGRVLLAALLVGLIAVLDAAAETAYLVIPKKEEWLSAGCCTTALNSSANPSRFLPQALFEGAYQPRLYSAYYTVNLIAILVLIAALSRSQIPFGNQRYGKGMMLLLALAAISWVVNSLFLIEIAAPRLLNLPEHHCPYDLLSQAPESMIAIILFVLGSFSIGWAYLASRFANTEEARSFLPVVVGRLLTAALMGYLGSFILMAIELALA